MLVALGVAATLPSNAGGSTGSIERRVQQETAANGLGGDAGPGVKSATQQPNLVPAGPDAAAAAADLEGGDGSGSQGAPDGELVSERSRLLG